MGGGMGEKSPGNGAGGGGEGAMARVFVGWGKEENAAVENG